MTMQLLRMPYEENLNLFFIGVAEDTQPNLVSRILVFSISDIRQERRPRINKVLHSTLRSTHIFWASMYKGCTIECNDFQHFDGQDLGNEQYMIYKQILFVRSVRFLLHNLQKVSI